MPETRTRRPFGVRDATAAGVILALYRPYGRISSGPSPTSAATSVIGRSFAACAMAISEGVIWSRVSSHESRVSNSGTEHPGGIRGRPGHAFLHCPSNHLRQPFGRMLHERGLVPLAPHRNWSQVGTVGLDQQPVRGHFANQLILGPVPERDHPAPRDVMPQRDRAPAELRAAGE